MTGARKVQSVLFTCTMNAIRSPMAEALAKHYFGHALYIQSAGVERGTFDPFTAIVLEEAKIHPVEHRPQTLDDIFETEGFNFDLIVTLSEEAHQSALNLTRTSASLVEYWPTPDPSLADGSRDTRLDAYRAVRDILTARIRERLSEELTSIRA
jgi:protein-tyrosine-phosphatase